MSETSPREDRPTGISENEIQQLKKRADDLEITLGALIKLFIRKEYVSEEEFIAQVDRTRTFREQAADNSESEKTQEKP